MIEGKEFVCYWHFVGWENISFGITINFELPNFEIHLPFGFFRFGMHRYYKRTPKEIEELINGVLK